MKYFLFTFFLIGIFCLYAPGVSAQTLSVPLEDSYDIQQTFAVNILMDSEGQSINALEAYISYSSDTVQIIDVVPVGSAIDLWVSKPRVDETKHEIVLIGGIGGGAVMKDAPLVTLVVKTISSGEAAFTLDANRSGGYLNDGQGTRVSFTGPDVHAKVTTTTYEPSVIISSPTHPQEFLWYNASDAILTWDAGASNWSYQMSLDPAEAVDTTGDQPVGRVDFPNRSDGVHYFLLRQQLGGSVWSAPVIREVRVDTTAPEAFTVTKKEDDPLYGGHTVLVFQATDATSGIARYVIEDDRETYEADRSPVILRNPESSMARVTAYDYAGNKTSTEIKNIQERDWKYVVLACIAFFILLAILWSVRKRYQKTGQT